MKLTPELSSKGWNLEWNFKKSNKFVSFLKRIKFKFQDFYLEARLFPKFLKRVWDYLPVLYHDRDYDYTPILNMLAYKCKRTREYLEKYGHLASKHKVIKELKLTEHLISRIVEDDYCAKEYDEINRQYGSLTLLSRKVDDDNEEIIGARQILFTRDGCLSDVKLMKQEQEETQRLHKKAEKLKQDDYDMLFKHIRKRIQGWWD